MPRLSDEEDSSDLDSDTSSIHSIPDDASSLRNARGNHTAMVGGAYSTEYFVTGGSHVSGTLVDNRSKRKLRSHSNDNRATKVQRLGSPNLGLTQDELDALNRQDSADSDYATAEDDDDEDDGEEEEEEEEGGEEQLLEPKPEETPPQVARLEPVPPRPAVRRPSIRTHPAWPQQKSPGVQPQPQLANSNPKVITAWELMGQKLPHLTLIKEEVPWKMRFMTDLPAKRVPIMTGSFNINKTQNTVSYLAQVTGELLPNAEACEPCQTTRGVYDGCVVSRDPVLNEYFRGACARCWYSRQGWRCSFRKGELDEEDMSDDEIRRSNPRQDFLDKPQPPVVPEKPKQEPSQSNTPVPVPQVPSVPYRQLQKESQTFSQQRAFPQPGQVRTINRESQASTLPQNGNGNANSTASVRKETPVFPPKPNSIPSERRGSSAQTRASPPARPLVVPPKATTNETSGVATRTRSGTGASTTHQNDFAGLPVELPNFVTQIQQFNNQERSRKEAGSGSAPDSMSDRIDKYTKKYEGMALQQLLDAHKQLVEQNAEHNARMAAMMAVLIKKVDQVVGQANGADNGA